VAIPCSGRKEAVITTAGAVAMIRELGSGLLAGSAGQLGVDGGEESQDRRSYRRAGPGQGQGRLKLAAGVL